MTFLDNKEVGKRLRIKREEIGLNTRQFAMKAGIDQSHYSKIEKGDLPVTNKILAKLVIQYKIDADYILHGMNVPHTPHDDIQIDNPLKDEGPNYLATRRDQKLTKRNRVPLYDAQATGGMVETEMTPIHAPAGTIDIGDLLHDSQAAIRIYGNSMLPNYPPGCVIGLAKCESSFIEPGEVYVVETRDRRLLKRLFYKDDTANADRIVCYSDNIMKFEGGARDGKLAYPPFELDKQEIINLFVVTGVIKRNANSVIINNR